MHTDDSSQDPAARTRPSIDSPILPQPAPVRPSLPRYLFIAGTAAGPPITATGEVHRRERIQQAAAELDGSVERLASPFGDGMIYTICQLPSNRAAASFATVMQTAYATGVRTVALPKPRRRITYLTDAPASQAQVLPPPAASNRPTPGA